LQDLGRLLIVVGLILAVAGLFLLFGSKIGLGRLPGDIIIHKGPMRIFIPLATSLLLSVILSVLLWLFRK